MQIEPTQFRHGDTETRANIALAQPPNRGGTTAAGFLAACPERRLFPQLRSSYRRHPTPRQSDRLRRLLEHLGTRHAPSPTGREPTASHAARTKTFVEETGICVSNTPSA
ncbi:hypothetical protein [Celeribacter sp. SCSIO 80788]|uniref:hypothetical protein n=1 Tax=Celeribacter sp. SCSIO 80788 TaxID=3117013 RepID=UPI003DA2A8D6